MFGAGLTRDDEALHDDRIRLWDEFNRAWLTALQRQHDMTDDIFRANQAVRDPQSLMSARSLEHLSRELVRLCDMVERFGLVDYQMGVQEEEIMDCGSRLFRFDSSLSHNACDAREGKEKLTLFTVILRCLALLDPAGDGNGELASAQQAASSAAGSRGR